MGIRRDISRFVVIILLIALAIVVNFSGAIAENGRRNAPPAEQDDVVVVKPEEPTLLVAEVSNTDNGDENSIQQELDAATRAELEKVLAPISGILVVVFVVCLLFWLSRQQGPTIYR